jgi:AcrR family transcriptional regulator
MSSITPTSINSSTRQTPVETLTVARSQILEVAHEILAREGAGSVSLGRVARELGEKLPPLYEHFDSEDELLLCLAADVLLELTRELEDAGSDLLVQAFTYRRFALEHPRQYRLLTECPLPREVPADGLRARPPRAFLEQLGPDLAHAAWAFAHGMVQLELDQRFAPDTDLDAVWRAGIAALGAAPTARPNELRNDEHNGSALAPGTDDPGHRWASALR